MSHPAQNDTSNPTGPRHADEPRLDVQHLVTRLQPGSDLKQSLRTLVTQYQLNAATVVTCVGSLTQAHLRLAGATATQVFSGPFEIVSLVGTLSPDGLHLHLSISDAEGRVWGGHLLDDNIVHTTAEIALATYPNAVFSRPADPNTGYGELKIEKV